MEKEGYNHFMDLTARSMNRAIKENRVVKDINYPSPLSSVASHLAYQMRRTIETLDEELCRFEKNFQDKNNKVLWACDYDDVFNHLKNIIKDQQIKSYTALDSFDDRLMKELGIGYFVKDHKLNAASNGQMTLFEADRMVAETGSLLLINRNMGFAKSLNNQSVNVGFVTIDHILATLQVATMFTDTLQRVSPTLAKNNSGSNMLFRGSSHCTTYLIIVDNQRSSVLRNQQLREIYACIDCDHCKQACPIDQLIGFEPYDNVITGPRAKVLLPYLETMQGYNHIPFVCTMCGKCEEVCPMHLPLRQMMVVAKRDIDANKCADNQISTYIANYRKHLSDRKKMNRSAWLRQRKWNSYLSSTITENRELPKMVSPTFNEVVLSSKKKK